MKEEGSKEEDRQGFFIYFLKNIYVDLKHHQNNEN